MDEKKLFENNEEVEAEVALEETEEVTDTEEAALEETADVEDTEEAVDFEEEIAEDNAEETAETDENSEEALEEEPIFEEGSEELPYFAEAPKKSKKGLIIALVLIVIIALLGGGLAYDLLGNKYNKMGYLDISGMTLGEMCAQVGAPVEDFKKTYELPEDMPEDTYFNAAYNMMPVKIIAAMNYTDFATLKTEFKIPDTYIPEGHGLIGKIKALFSRKPVEITENTPWGIVQGELTLDLCVGEENMEEFKNEYGFGDNITLETQWKEVRPIIEKATIKDRIEQEKAAAEAETDTEGAEGAEGAEGEVPAETDTADTASTEDTDTAAEGTEAE